jgi:hypothetical protein
LQKRTNMKTYFLALIVFLVMGSFSAQKDIFLHINPTFNNTAFALNTTYTGIDGVALNMDHFNYYISDIKLFHDGGIQTNIAPAVFLFTPDQVGFYLGNYNIQDLESIRFMVGVPSRLNTQSGAEAVDISSYPDTHPLSFQNPTMYWGWQFGYMHMIVGGEADSNNDQLPDAYFEMHNLGDHNQRTIQMPVIETNTNASQMDIYLACQVDQWLRDMPLSSVGVLHDQTGLNDSVMANVLTYPVFTQPQTAGMNTSTSPQFWVEGASIHWMELEHAYFKVFDLSGRLVSSGTMNGASGEFTLDLNAGNYFVTVFDSMHRTILSKQCIISRP